MDAFYRTNEAFVMRHAKEVRLGLCSLLLMVAATTGFVSAAMTSSNLPGFERFRGGLYRRSPTATYEGHFSAIYYGAYHQLTTKPVCRHAFPPCLDADEILFYLENDAGSLVRLVFYCGLDYCTRASQISLTADVRAYVKGTLIQPTQWRAGTYEPDFHFVGDLYVFQYKNLDETYNSTMRGLSIGGAIKALP